MSASPRTILAAEDRPAIQQTIRLQIRSRFRNASIVEARNQSDALRLCGSERPDLIVLDSDLDDCDGLQLIKAFAKLAPLAKTVVYSGYVDPFTIYRVGNSPARGFVAKGEKAGELGEAATMILEGGKYYSEYVRKVLQELATREHAFSFRLTDWEMELLGEFGCGRSNDEMAAKYAISAHTARNHRANIMSKLDLETAEEMALYAFKNGFTRQRFDGSLRAVAPLSSGPRSYE